MIYILKILTDKQDSTVQNEIKELVSSYMAENKLSGSCSLQGNLFLSLHSREENGIVKQIRQESIIYIEKRGHKVLLYTHNGNFSYYSSFKKLLEQLDSDIFVRVHQGFIVNINEIKMVFSDELSLISVDRLIPISRRSRVKLNKLVLPS